MPRFGFVGASYTAQSINADAQECINLYCEPIESQQGKGQMVLLCTPGLKKLYDLGAAGMRGEITAQGRTFAVSGTLFYELLPPNANPNKTSWGPIVNDGQPVSMTSGPNQVLIASAGKAYVFNLTTGALADVSVAVGAPISQVGYSDGFFFVLFKNSNKIQSSLPLDATQWPGAAATVVSVFTDNVVAIFVDHREMWVFGPKAIQPYFDSGNFPFPMDVREGAFIESGLAAQFSVAKADNSIFWLEADDRGNSMVRRANGYTPARISTFAVEYALSTYPTLADAIAYTYKEQGHEFYVLTFPTAQKTWAFDCATGLWAKRGYWNSAGGGYLAHRGMYHTFNFGQHLVGDPTTGAVYGMSISYLDDFGNPIRRLRRAPHVSREQRMAYHNEIQIDVETGLGPALQGNAPATVFFLADTAGVFWQTSVSDQGALLTVKSNAGVPAPFYLSDAAAKTSWLITVTLQGVLMPVNVPYNPTYPGALPMVSQTGNLNFDCVIYDLGGGIAQPDTLPMGIVTRGPQMMLRWYDDAGRVASNEYVLDCGKPGEYKKRVRKTRLGRSRDRVYEITMTDPVPWRIPDAYLFTDQDRVGQDRLVREMGKRA